MILSFSTKANFMVVHDMYMIFTSNKKSRAPTFERSLLEKLTGVRSSLGGQKPTSGLRSWRLKDQNVENIIFLALVNVYKNYSTLDGGGGTECVSIVEGLGSQ